jgi:TonB family protein
MNAKVFINYRREDTAPYAGRLYDRLTAHFGEGQVFIDIDQIEPGEDFVEAINRKVGTCDIAIVAIGPNWLRATDASGKRRLDDEEDFVRMEIVAALQRKIRVIPVLVGGARMPGRHDLPEALAPLSRRNAIELSETRFHADVNQLIEAIEKSFAVAEKKVELSATPVAPPAEQASVRPLESKHLPEAAAPPLERHLGNLVKSVNSVLKSPPIPGATVPAQPEEASILKPPIPPSPWRKPTLIALAIAALMIVVGAGWYLVHKREVPSEKPAVTPTATSTPISMPSATVTPIPTAVPTLTTLPPIPEHYFNDYAGVTTQREQHDLNERLAKFDKETTNQVVVAIFPKMDSASSLDEYTLQIAKAWGVGQGDKANGVILFVFVSDRKMRIQVGYGLTGVLTDVLCKEILEQEITPYLQKGDFGGGLAAGIDSILRIVRGQPTSAASPMACVTPVSTPVPTPKPRLVYAPAPAFPPGVSQAGVSGTGRFRLTFDSEGNVTNVQVVKSTGDPYFDQAAIKTLRQWKSAPGQEWAVTVPVTFRTK